MKLGEQLDRFVTIAQMKDDYAVFWETEKRAGLCNSRSGIRRIKENYTASMQGTP